MEDSVFTRIIKGELPSHKVYEDDHVLAFMDIQPVQPSQVVITTKKQIENFEELDDETAAGFWRGVQIVGRKLRSAFPEKRKIAVQIEGLEVPHVHAKLFPFDTAADFHAPPSAATDHEALEALAAKLREIN